ncbi:hypothetical protein DFS34DRAFT_513867 [Phlyctochytrium arcticum]|nr:hypothetical protein DFS34DRAFT_513867 [Phlyctochytrium arcticum]
MQEETPQDAVQEVDGVEDPSAELNINTPLTSDQGLTKKIIQLGEGWDRPQKGDEVFVTYIGRLVPDGEIFDQNVNLEHPFSFKLGKGMVIKGWDCGIATMLKGEKAIFKMKPEYAYGARGSPPKIPPNATLEFEVQMLSWKSIDALSSDGEVMIKMTKTDESAWQTPKDGWEVVVNLQGLYCSGVKNAEEETKVFVERKELMFVVGKETEQTGDIFPASCEKSAFISEAIKKFKKGDQGSVIFSAKHAFGHNGNATLGVPPDCSIRYDLELVQWREIDNIGSTPVVKKILQAGNGWESPKLNANVQVRVHGRSLPSGDPIPEISSVGSENQLFVGSPVLPECVSLALEHMKEGERALITAPADYGFGKNESAVLGLLAADSLEFEVELVNFEKLKTSDQLTRQEKYDALAKGRELGNVFFKDGKLRMAMKQYEVALKVSGYDTPQTPILRKAVADSSEAEPDTVAGMNALSCHLNLAACYLKTESYTQVITHATRALSLQPTNTKAYYRRAQAYLANEELDQALNDADAALRTLEDGGDEGVRKEVSLLKRRIASRIKAIEQKEKSMFARMMGGMATAQ